MKSLAAPWVFCSLHTARQLLGFLLPPDHVTYLLARCDTPGAAKEVAAELRDAVPDDMVVYTAEEFSTSSRLYWLFRTKAGLAIGYAALLGLLVGMVITAQTLYSATAANAKEFAILLALGIPRWRISLMVLAQSFWVGVIGIALAYPICLGLRCAGAAVRQRRRPALGGAGRHRGAHDRHGAAGRGARPAQRPADRTDDALLSVMECTHSLAGNAEPPRASPS